MRLRTYQADLIRRANAAFAAGVRRVCLQLETGAGKTVIAAAMTNSLVRQSGPGKPVVLFLVHRRELVRQTVATMGKFVGPENVGVIAAGSGIKPWAPIQVGSIPTLYQRLETVLKWLRPRLVFGDEFHHFRARTFEEVLEAFSDRHMVGLTATPERLDGRGLGQHAETLICGPPYIDLANAGALARVDVYSPTIIDTAKIKKVRGDYSRSDQDKRISDVVVADVVAAYMRHAPGRRMIHFAVTKRASREAVAAFTAAGIRAEHVDDSTDPLSRDGAFRRFAAGETQILSNVEIATEGVDIPDCQGVILARKTMSMGLYRQWIGRGSRPKSDGGNNLVLDCAQNFDEHGHPMAPVAWSLEDGAIRDQESDNGAGMRKCEACSFVYPSRRPSCPLCNHVPQTRTASMAEAELVERGIDDNESPAAGPRRNINQEVLLSGGDPEKLNELAKLTKNPRGAIAAWKRVFGQKWEEMRRRRGG